MQLGVSWSKTFEHFIYHGGSYSGSYIVAIITLRYMFPYLIDTEHNSGLCSSSGWGFRQSKTDRLWVHKQ